MFNTVRLGGWCGPDIEGRATAGKVADDHLKGDHQEMKNDGGWLCDGPTGCVGASAQLFIKE